MSRPKSARSIRTGRCDGCDSKLRAGSTHWALLPIDGGFERIVLCRRCFRRCLPVFPPKPAEVPPLCACGKEVASVGAECVNRALACGRK